MNLPFTLIDVAIVLLLLAAIWAGYRSGFIATTYGLATWVVSFAAAVVFLLSDAAAAFAGQTLQANGGELMT